AAGGRDRHAVGDVAGPEIDEPNAVVAERRVGASAGVDADDAHVAAVQVRRADHHDLAVGLNGDAGGAVLALERGDGDAVAAEAGIGAAARGEAGDREVVGRAAGGAGDEDAAEGVEGHGIAAVVEAEID